MLGRLGHAEVDDFWDRSVVLDGHQHVGRLDVAVDDALLVGVLDALTDLHKEVKPFGSGEAMLVAVLGNADTGDVLHSKVGLTLFGRPRLEDPGHVRMVHHRQGLPLGLEPGDDLAGVHAQLDDLQGDPPADGLLLLGQVDNPHSALAEDFENPEGADALGECVVVGTRTGPASGPARAGFGIRHTVLRFAGGAIAVSAVLW